MFFSSGKNIFCFRAAKFVSATYVSRATKLGNICLRNNVSATMFPSLARPLNLKDEEDVKFQTMAVLAVFILEDG